MPRLLRRTFLEGALNLALLPLACERASAGASEGEGAKIVTRNIVMLHGAKECAWCFDTFRTVFQDLGWTCHAPDLIGHGAKAADAAKTLVGVGMADYRAQLETFLKTIAPQPVLLGHSMGALLAQLLAAQGILPQTDGEKKLGQDLMGLGPFWKTVINPDFDLARVYSLNRVPEDKQRAIFAEFGPESGRAFFELFFWMFDRTGATIGDTKAVTCPVLCLAGADDNLVSVATVKATAAGYPGATFWELQGHGHMLVLEPGAEAIARRIAAWIPN